METASEINISAAPNLLPCPAVSIIVPVYNAEKYIGELLDSVLAQTLQNFEIIVVDDCSTDSSPEVVKSYLEKFDGRLTFARMKKNSGSAPAPRNKGFRFARGEYIFFMDSDDTLTQTALEEMYGLAKEYEADVVYCEKYYMSTGVGQEFIDNMHVADKCIQIGGFVEEPTLITNDIPERLKDLSKKRFWVTPWQRLVSRKLLVDYEIRFPRIIGSDDVVWCFQVLCCAKRFLRVPNMCYVRRMYEESFTASSKKSPNRHIHQWMDIVIRGLKFADNFMSKLPFFKEHPGYRYEGIRILAARTSFSVIYPVQATLKPSKVYDIFKKEFSKDTGENDVLVSFLCTQVCSMDKTLRDTKEKLKVAEREARENKERAAELENELKEKLLDTPARPFTFPAISVVVPMYNAEETITETLDSLLIQTFKDFEVIVADDCSTDNSVAIVESYKEKFGERLQIVQTKKNSGGGGYIPRNLGLDFASGEYVIFLDADDFLLGTALETLYMAAKKYNADVVYSSTYYNVVEPNDVYLYRDGFGRKLFKEGIEDKTELNVNASDKIFREFLASSEGNFRAPWSKFVRRDFLLKNEIRFPDIVTGGDCIWCINVYAYAKRFLRLPTPLYFYRRYNSTSLTRTMRNSKEQLTYWVSAFVSYLSALKSLQDRTEILRENPSWCYEAVRGGHFEWVLNRTNDARTELSNKEVYNVLYQEFKGNKDLLGLAVPFFFSTIDFKQKDLNDKKGKLKKANELVKTQKARLAELEDKSEKEE